MQTTSSGMPIYAHPSHLPCPDLMAESMTEKQREVGLRGVKSARKHLLEIQLKPLRKKTAELKEKGRATESLSEQKAISKEIDRIQRQAERIQERWG